MICLTGLVGFLLVLTAEARVGNSSELDFCGETEQCLLFDLICKTNKYEVRHYDSVKWVSTDYSAISMEFIMIPSFWRLYGYITGDYNAGQKINMTAPVVMKIPKMKNLQTGTFTMSFLLPAEHQMNPPQPTNDNVYIQEMPAMNVYVTSYETFMITLNDKKHADTLADALVNVSAQYEDGFHYAAGYNSPMSKKKRHNEVWYIAEGDPECSSSKGNGQNSQS
ncbi:heme-binding protein 2 [Fundulus heteroclitus]|uniref:heme-binding protein 2 n=1 Tax=Fundulus heteroclitus TaxID=8078 RepID=UPI00165AF2BC|nr:heme-binding protein 2 [Fundulus heteroclitus]